MLKPLVYVVLMISIVCPAVSYDMDDKIEYVVNIKEENFGPNNELIQYSAVLFIEGKPFRFLLSSGSELPVIDSISMQSVDFELTQPPGALDKGFSIANGLKIDFAKDPSNKLFSYRGPVYVQEEKRLRAMGFDGLMPLNMIAFYDCEVVDFAEKKITLKTATLCKEQFNISNRIVLDDHSSAVDFPFWTSTANIDLNGKTLRLLIDTFVSQSFIKPQHVGKDLVTDTIIPKFRPDGSIFKGNKLKPLCLKYGNKSKLMKNFATFDEKYDYQIDGSLGTDFLSSGKLIYAAKGESYFVFNDGISLNQC